MEEELHQASVYNRSLIEASVDRWLPSARKGRLPTLIKRLRTSPGEAFRTDRADFSDYFTEPDKARAGYQQVFAKGFVTIIAGAAPSRWSRHRSLYTPASTAMRRVKCWGVCRGA